MHPDLVLVTGATGFVGQALCAHLMEANVAVRAPVRRLPETPIEGVEYRPVGDIAEAVDWAPLLQGVAAVAHLAARVHRPGARGPEALAAFRRANVAASVRLAEAAARAGVSRFVHVSSIKARADPANAEREPYEQSKWEAEAALHAVAGRTGLPLVILRPPLVYGPGARANMALLMRAVRAGLPLPLGSVENRRSVLYVGNLASAIAVCLTRPEAAGRTFELSDGPPVSTPDLIRAIAAAMGKSAWLWPCPPAALRAAATALGRRGAIARLTEDLVADDTAIRDALGWRPPFTLAEGLARTLRRSR